MELYYKIKKIIRVLINYPKSLFTSYKLQIDEWRCGPIAIYNALAFFNRARPSIKELTAKCYTTEHFGTQVICLENVLYEYFDSVVFVDYNRFLVEQIDEHLKDKGIVIIRYLFEDYNNIGHYALVIDDKYTVINPIDGVLSEQWTHKRLKHTMNFSAPNRFPACAWLIK